MGTSREWIMVRSGEYYRRGYGTVTRRADGWYGSNSIVPDVDCDPTVGPLTSCSSAKRMIEVAMDERFR